ncbi:MAG: hypothetical protein DI637_02485 [Citromicrobium sp.]|nr:MAG: hypothetical protein DI637_02485 [Citromicrobium sp.]
MRRITPYLFFVLAIGTFAMIALDDDQSWQAEEVDPLQAVLLVAAAFAGAHVLRLIVTRFFANRASGDE